MLAKINHEGPDRHIFKWVTTEVCGSLDRIVVIDLGRDVYIQQTLPLSYVVLLSCHDRDSKR